MYFSSAPSGPPTHITTNSTASNITVRWGPVECLHHNGDITGYSVVLSNSEDIRRVSVDHETREVTIYELCPFTDYTVSVAAVNRAGTGVYSNDITVKTEG